MLDFILAPQTAPFLFALALMLLIALLEGGALLFGTGLTDLVDNVLPATEVEMRLDQLHFEAEAPLTNSTAWWRIGKLPILVMIVLFLFWFGVTGLLIQDLVLALIGGCTPRHSILRCWASVEAPLVGLTECPTYPEIRRALR